MIGFWVAAALLASGAAALVLMRAARAATAMSSIDPRLDVYRRALKEVDDLGDRDLINADERRSIRTEAARRLIAASERPVASVSASQSPAVPVAAAAIIGIAALLLYWQVGSPGAADQPFAGRMRVWRAHPDAAPPAALAAMLDAVAKARPQDTTPLRKLAALDLELGDADGAAHTLRRAMAIAPSDAGLATTLAEVKLLQSGGVLNPDVRALFQRALKADPADPAARYYLAKAKMVDGQVPAGLAEWRSLLMEIPANDPRRSVLADEIDRVQATGQMVSATAPPTADTASRTNDAIQGMVEGLAERLAAQPQDPDGWVRLVRAYAVLGEIDKRDAALQRARSLFAGRANVVTALAQAAQTPAMANR